MLKTNELESHNGTEVAKLCSVECCLVGSCRAVTPWQPPPTLKKRQPFSEISLRDEDFLESDKKTSREALHNWKSTYAVKHLREVVENASPIEGLPLFSSIKDGVQKKNGYKNMILLYYQFKNEQIDYLNFTVKLTIGVTASQKHIQYSVNKVEAAK